MSRRGERRAIDETLDRLLRSCTVRVKAPDGRLGTGFFVLPGQVLTCAHVITTDGKPPDKPVIVFWSDFQATAVVDQLFPAPYPDVAILRVDLDENPEYAEHPCVRLDEAVQVHTPVYAFGYSQERPHGDPITADVEGFVPVGGTDSTQEVLKIKAGQVVPGMSGAPLLNEVTGGVCGILRRTRDREAPTGGFAVPTRDLLRLLPALADAQREYHRANPYWPEAPRLSNAPGLPATYVPRAELVQTASALLDVGMAPVAIRGMPGVGKTVLAQAVANNPDIRSRFPGGIAWITVGRDPPDLLPLVKVAARMTGDAADLYDSLETAGARLREHLARRSALVVLDDVWSAEDATPFLPREGRCRVLLTTRDSGVATALQAETVLLGVLPVRQAVALLRAWSRRDDPGLETLARRLGELPLALRIAGTRLRGGLSAREYIEQFDRVSRMKDGYRARAPDDNVQVCFDLSVERLENERPLFLALGVFPEDRPVPQHAVTRLWRTVRPDLSEHDCGELLQEMARLGLLEFGIQRTFSMHDLLHEYCREQAGDTLAKYRDTLLRGYNPSAAPWATVPDDGYLHANLAWHLEDAGRADDLRALLLEEAADRNAWYSVRAAADDTTGFLADVDRAWRIAESDDRVAASDDALLPRLGDEVRFAMVHASVRSLSADFPTPILSALVRSGVWSLDRAIRRVRQFPDPNSREAGLVALAVLTHGEAARDTLLEACAVVSPPAWDALERWKTLLRALVEKGFAGDAKRLLLETDTPRVQAYLAAELATAVADEPLLARQLLELQRKYEYPHEDGDRPYWRLDILTNLVRSAPSVRGEAAADLLTLLRSQCFYYFGGEAWATLLEALPVQTAEALLPEAMKGLDEMPGAGPQTHLVQRLAACVPAAADQILGKALKRAFFPNDQASCIAAVWPALTAEVRERSLEELLSNVRPFPHPDYTASALARAAILAPHRAGPLWDEAFAAARDAHVSHRREFARQFASNVPSEKLKDVIEAVDVIDGGSEALRTMEELLTARPEPAVFDRVDQLIGELQDESSRGHLAAALAQAAYTADSTNTLLAALSHIEALTDRIERAQWLAKVLPLLQENRRREAASHILGVVLPPTDWRAASALQTAAGHAIGDEQEIILSFAISTNDLNQRTTLLSSLADRLPPERLRRVVAAAGRIGDRDEVFVSAFAAKDLADLLSRPPNNTGSVALSPSYVQLLRGHIDHSRSGDDPLVVAGARAIAGLMLRAGAARAAVSSVSEFAFSFREYPLAAAVEEVAVHLSPADVDYLVGRVIKVIGRPHALQRIHRVLRFLTPARRHSLIEEFFVLAQKGDNREKAQWLAWLAPYLDVDRREAAVRYAVDLFLAGPLSCWPDTWIAIAPLLNAAELEQAHQAARNRSSDYDHAERAEMLLALAPFRAAAFVDAMDEAWLADKPERAELLARHAPRLSGRARDEALMTAATAAGSLPPEELCVSAYVMVAIESDLTSRAKLLSSAVDAALDAGPNEGARLLRALVPHLLGLPHVERARTATGVIRRMARHNRPGALAFFRETIYLTAAVGGTAALRDCAAAIEDVGRWWP